MERGRASGRVVACGKKKFASRAEARSFAAQIRKGRAGGQHQRAYRCDDSLCAAVGYWHLTSMSAAHTAFYREREALKGARI
jgi:hypothetical protein